MGLNTAAPAPTTASTAPATPSGARGRPRLVVLDLLRFVAAASVMMFHFTGVADPRWWGTDPRGLFTELQWARFGSYGVDLFFVISGFVILMSAWGRRPGDFAVSRVTRLFPAYWTGVTLTVVLFAITGLEQGWGPGKDGVWRRFLPNLTMLQTGAGVPNMEGLYWTLWVELHFYALIALFVWWGMTYSRCIGFMSAWLLLGLYAKEAKFGLLESALVSDYAPFFIAGMAFYLIYTYGSNIVLWLFVAACAALTSRYTLNQIQPELYWKGVHEYVGPGIVIAIFVLLGLVATHRLDWIRWRPLTTLGALTYPLYLVHLTVFRPVVRNLYPELNRWVVLACCVTAALTTAYVIYRFIEQPGGKWLNRQLKTALAQIRTASRPAAPAASQPEAPVAANGGPAEPGPRDTAGRLTQASGADRHPS